MDSNRTSRSIRIQTDFSQVASGKGILSGDVQILKLDGTLVSSFGAYDGVSLIGSGL